MDAQTSQQTALAVMCLMCISPAILGVVIGAWIQRRLTNHGGWPAAFVPAWFVRWLQERANK